MATENELTLLKVMLKRGNTPLSQIIGLPGKLKNDDVLKVMSDYGPERIQYLELRLCRVDEFEYVAREKAVLFATVEWERLILYEDNQLKGHGLKANDQVKVVLKMGSGHTPFRLVITKL